MARQIPIFLFFILFLCAKLHSQNSTVYGIHGFGEGEFSHIDIATGEIRGKSKPNIFIHDGTSTYDPKTQTYFIAGNRDTGMYLVSIHAPSGKIEDEMPLRSKGQLWSGFEFDIKTGKIYVTRQDSITNKLYFSAIDPANKTWQTLGEIEGVYVASSAGSALDHENGFYFFGSYGTGGFHVTTMSLQTGEKLYSVPVNLPMANYHYDTAAKKLFALYSSIPMFAKAVVDYKNGNHVYDSIPYLRSYGTILGSWYTYDQANSNYIIPYSEIDSQLITIIGIQPPQVKHTVVTENELYLTELEYDALPINNFSQVSGSVKTSSGSSLPGATVFACIKNASGNFEFKDSTLTDAKGNFTLTTSIREFYIFIVPDQKWFPSEVPTWYPRTAYNNNAKIFGVTEGINLITVTTVHVSALDLAENAGQIQVKVFPNPASSEIHIQTETNIQKLQILDALGRIIIEKDCENAQNMVLPFPQDMCNGLYYIRLAGINSIITKSFIIR